jgi:hypothetical protein
MPSNTHIHHGLGGIGVLGRMPPTSTAAVYVDGRELNAIGGPVDPVYRTAG